MPESIQNITNILPNTKVYVKASKDIEQTFYIDDSFIPIIFDKTQMNFDEVYDKDTGVFTCNKTGTYLVIYNFSFYSTFIEYSLQDTGPAGGSIFYDKGDYSDGWRWMEAAPLETEWTSKRWGIEYFIEGTGTAIGTGQINTPIIADWLIENECLNGAAVLCDELLVYGDYYGYSDWFLPSKDELNLIYTNLYLNDVGDFSDSKYWSSSEIDSSTGWCLDFGEESPSSIDSKLSFYSVRAARQFGTENGTILLFANTVI